MTPAERLMLRAYVAEWNKLSTTYSGPILKAAALAGQRCGVSASRILRVRGPLSMPAPSFV